MNIAQHQEKVLFINLDILFDFYSVLFSAYRTYFSKHSIPIHELKHLIEGKDFDEGLARLVQEVSGSTKFIDIKEELHDMINMSLSSIKPNIGVYTILTDLAKHGVTIKTFTHFEEYIWGFVKQAHNSWFDFEILQCKDESSLKEAIESYNIENVVLVNSSVETCLEMAKQLRIPTIYVPYSKKAAKDFNENEKYKELFENNDMESFETLDKVNWKKYGITNTIQFPESSYYLQLKEKPKNLEYNVWNNIIKFDKPIEINSDIVHGYGRGGKKLGIPTANLDMTADIEEKLSNFVNGVYYGWAEFLPSGEVVNEDDLEYRNKYPMVMSIGFNPYFNNKHKTAEAHIMKSFEHDFYGSKISVTILGFIRNEADFMSFSHLIEAIHNDVQIAKDVLHVDTN